MYIGRSVVSLMNTSIFTGSALGIEARSLNSGIQSDPSPFVISRTSVGSHARGAGVAEGKSSEGGGEGGCKRRIMK